MKKIFIFILLVLLFYSCSTDNNILISQNEIELKSFIPSNKLTNYKFLDSVKTSEIYYRSDDLKIQGFISHPKHFKKYPVIIYCRGGNKSFGEITPKTCLGLSGLASNGYFVVASNYRGSSKSEGEDEFGGSDINDILTLFDLIKEFDNVDTNKIAIIGGSRGGIMAYLTLKQLKKNIKAAIITAAPSDLNLLFKNRPEMENIASKLIPNFNVNKEEEIRKRSVIYWADSLPNNIPIMLLHGTDDKHVSIKNSVALDKRFTELNIPHKLVIFENDDHYLSNNHDSVIKLREKWLQKYLLK